MESESNPGVDDSPADRGVGAPLSGGSSSAAAVVADGVPVKRKRGRPARPKKEGAPVVKKSKKEDENVCFVCFDGGDLVLCDRRFCPKAYHPRCIKRDAAYFAAQARWECGWHQCKVCESNALFKCYTCPYSLCKDCLREGEGADISCVRGNKGFCKVCRDIILLFEYSTRGINEVVHVDFDDKGSWEYLFKVYWIYTKQKESLTLDELLRATNPWKNPPLNHRVKPSLTTTAPSSQNVSAKAVSGRVNPSSDYPSTCVNKPPETGPMSVNNQVETNTSKRRKTRKQQPLLHNSSPAKVVTDELQDSKSNWASKELLDFCAHMENGDAPVLSQFDVQGLLLEYIRRNNLRNPLKRCEIICDARLEILFGKTRVGHFEMLKRIEYLFKDESSPSGAAHAVDTDDISDSKVENKKQVCKKLDIGKREDNLDSYAAINYHNMNLVYLRRSLVENLLEDAKKFHDKVVGAIVRIRIPGNDPKQEMYRLVRVVGASKADETYKVGERETDIKLKILNLNKIEDILIASISNQDFSKDECRRLRQSIKCGLVDRMTVGEVQEKAMVLQEVRIKDVLESEISKLNHLRDRASEMGHRKQLRECVEKLEVLKSPEERERRIRNIPEVHVDPRMDPKYQSDEDSEQSDDEKEELDQNKRQKHTLSSSTREAKRIVSTTSNRGKEDDTDTTRCRESSQTTQTTLELETDAARILEELRNQGNQGRTNTDHNSVKSVSDPKVTDDASVASSSSGLAYASESFELERIWLYEDPSGNIQGPFCMLQLKKWNTSNYFPSGFRIWRTDQNKENSVLLTDIISMDELEVRSEQGARPKINLNPDSKDAVVKDHGQESLSSGSQLAPSENQISSCVSDACPSSSIMASAKIDQDHKPESANLPTPTPESDPGCEGLKLQPSVEKLESNLNVEIQENQHPSEKVLDSNLNAETEENQHPVTSEPDLVSEEPKQQASEMILGGNLSAETEENQHPVTSEPDPVSEEPKQQASEMILGGNLSAETEENQHPVTSEPDPVSEEPKQQASEMILGGNLSAETEENQHPVTSEPDLGSEEPKQQASEMIPEGNLNAETKENQNPVIIMDLNADACQTDFPEMPIQPRDANAVEPTSQVPEIDQPVPLPVIWNPSSSEIDGGVKSLENNQCEDLGTGGSWSDGTMMGSTSQVPESNQPVPLPAILNPNSAEIDGCHYLGTGGSWSDGTMVDDLSWLDGRIELNTLGDVSVSDLLGEVEDMGDIQEFLSPELDEDFGDTIELPIEDCYRLVGLSPPLEPETQNREPWIDTPELLAAGKRAECSLSPDELNPPRGPTDAGQWERQPPAEGGGGGQGGV